MERLLMMISKSCGYCQRTEKKSPLREKAIKIIKLLQKHWTIFSLFNHLTSFD